MTDDHQNPLNQRIEETHTSVRLANALANPVLDPKAWATAQGLPPPRTLRDLTQWSEADLLRLPHLGPRCLTEITEILAQEGAALRRSEAPIQHLQADQILHATNDVVAAVRSLPLTEQTRALRAACAILGITFVFD